MLNFVLTKKNETEVLTDQGGVMLGYIDQNNVFFPNNNMMFRVEWMLEIARFMNKRGEIPLSNGLIAHYKVSDIKWDEEE